MPTPSDARSSRSCTTVQVQRRRPAIRPSRSSTTRASRSTSRKPARDHRRRGACRRALRLRHARQPCPSAQHGGGQRWMLTDVAGKPIYAWDSRDHRFRTAYDLLRRPPNPSYARVEAHRAPRSRRRCTASRGRTRTRGTSDPGVVEVRDQAGVPSRRTHTTSRGMRFESVGSSRDPSKGHWTGLVGSDGSQSSIRDARATTR